MTVILCRLSGSLYDVNINTELLRCDVASAETRLFSKSFPRYFLDIIFLSGP